MFGRTILLALALFAAGVSLRAGEMDGLITAFTAIRTNTVWPVIGGGPDDIEETFGPRRQPSAGGRYDWHRGIDIDEAHGHTIVAALAGEFNRYTNYAAGGWTVVLKHTFAEPIEFRGKTLRNFYTFYMHLDDAGTPAFIKEAQTNGTHPQIARGKTIGLMGNTGEGPGGVYATHLHFELRVGTISSLEFQLANNDPASPSFYGFDPHLHPMLLFPPVVAPARFELTRPLAVATLATNIITMPYDEYPILNRIEVETLSDTFAQLDLHTLDLNLRQGFDPSSTAALDTAQTNRPYFAPLYFVDAQTNFQTQVVLPADFATGAAHVQFRAWDIWGHASLQTYPIGPPAFSIARAGENIVLSLPDGYTAPTLEATAKLDPPAVWTPLPPGVLQMPATAPEKYFRLRWP